jgi:hypothetical protein
MRTVVDLPAPLGPRNPKSEPRGTERSTASTAIVSSKRLVSPRATIAAGGGFALTPSAPHAALR